MHDFLETAKLAVQLQADEIRAAFSAKKTITEKADTSLVTETDRTAEQAIQNFIRSRHPDHEILGEEHGTSGEKGRYHWTIDPIDGTSNFARGIPLFTTAVALLDEGVPTVAAAYEPIVNDLYWAAKGSGSFLNDQPLHMGPVTPLQQAIVGFNRTREQKAALGQLFTHLQTGVGTSRILGSNIVAGCYVAAGRIDVLISLNTDLWDIAPVQLIATEAGAVAVTFSGQPWQSDSGQMVLAHPELATQIVAILQQRKEKETYA